MPLRSRGGAVIYGTSLVAEAEKEAADQLIDDLEAAIDRVRAQRKLRRAIVRTALPCITYVYMNSTDVFIAANSTDAITSTIYIPMNEGSFTADDIVRDVRWEHGLKEPVVFHFERSLVALPTDSPERIAGIESIAAQFVNVEVERYMAENQLITISPIFGNARFRVQETLCFVLMPYTQELTDVYETVVKPTIEKHGLVARRADDIRGIQPIMTDIWKSICEARFVLADLTGRNPNVFYELGIAHTVGKNTILISQQEKDSIPFDISHIRQIRYSDNVRGLETLRTALDGTIGRLLSPAVTT